MSLLGDGDPDDGLRVAGGAGGTVALLSDLDRVAADLVALGQVLDDVHASLWRMATAGPVPMSVPLAPVTGVRLEAALAALELGPTGVLATATAVRGLGVAVAAATAGYRAADDVATAVLRRLETTAGLVAGTHARGLLTASVVLPGSLLVTAAALSPAPLVTVTSLSRAAVALSAKGSGGSDTRQAGDLDTVGADQPTFGARLAAVMLRLLGSSPGLGDHAVATVPAVLSGLTGLAVLSRADTREVLAMLRAGTTSTPWLRENRQVTVDVRFARSGTAARGVADLLAGAAAQYPAGGGGAGSVRIDRIDRVERAETGVASAGGRRSVRARSWVVQVPGTQEWSPRPGSNPLDLTSDVAALGGRGSAAGALVVQGLRACGARPGEPVLIVGHSLGGIVAAELSADPALRREFRITHVVAAGAPTALAGVPDDVQVLSLEHEQDPVPWLDGAPTPEGSNWVSVRRPVGDPLTAHDVDEYVATGRMVDASTDPTITRFTEGLGPFLAGPDTDVTGWQATGRRVH